MRTESNFALQAELETDPLGPSDNCETEADVARNGKRKDYVRLTEIVPRKDVIALEVLRIRLMKKGQDVALSRLLSEAIRNLCDHEKDIKVGAKNV